MEKGGHTVSWDGRSGEPWDRHPFTKTLVPECPQKGLSITAPKGKQPKRPQQENGHEGRGLHHQATPAAKPSLPRAAWLDLSTEHREKEARLQSARPFHRCKAQIKWSYSEEGDSGLGGGPGEISGTPRLSILGLSEGG